MRMRVVLGLLVIAACGEGGASDPDGPPGDAPDPAVVETRSVTIGPVNVPAGGEETVCVVVDLGNTEARMVRAIRTELTSGTHHVIVTKSDEAPGGLHGCGPFAGGGVGEGLLFIAQQSEASLVYPAGAGLPIEAHQSIHLEMHYFNPGDTPLAIAGTAHLDLAEATTGLRPVELLFTGNFSLSIPARSMTSVQSDHSLAPGVQLFATTAHTHRWGTRATVSLDGRVLHESTNWAERPVDSFAPITIRDGQSLHLTCDFFNQSDTDVSFGTGAEDEMCFLWAHYVLP